MRRLELLDVIQTDRDAIEWAREKRLIISDPMCDKCGQLMKEVEHKSVDKVIWQCRRRLNGIQHDVKMSIRKVSIFSDCSITIRKMLLLMYEWSVRTSVESASFELSLERKTTVMFYFNPAPPV